MIEALEVEFKYKADEISLTDFHAFCKAKKPVCYKAASGTDHFYSSEQDKVGVFRHRVGKDMNQLTFKRKLEKNNNFIRTEHNIELKENYSSQKITSFCEELGYKYNTSLFKNCFIYIYLNYTLVYYVVYDSEMMELGRFIEIEMAEDHDWEGGEQEIMGELTVMERLCKPLGISPQSRVKRSLWEMYRK